MLVLLSQRTLRWEFYYTYRSLLTRLRFYWNTSFVHIEKKERKGDCPNHPVPLAIQPHFQRRLRNCDLRLRLLEKSI